MRRSIPVPVHVATFRITVAPGFAVQSRAFDHQRIIGVQTVGRKGCVIFSAAFIAHAWTTMRQAGETIVILALVLQRTSTRRLTGQSRGIFE